MELEVAVPTPVGGTFTYLSEAEVPSGSRVLVPFGRRKVVGVVMGPAVPAKEARQFELKAISEVIDDQPIYSEVVLKIARWLSWYYMHPIGEVLRTMLPASATKSTKRFLVLTEKGKAGRDEVGVVDSELRLIFGKRDQLSEVHLKGKLKTLTAAGKITGDLSLVALLARKLVKPAGGSSVRARKQEAGTPELPAAVVTQALELTPKQRQVYEHIRDHALLASGAKRPVLLWGLTGSGKTEIYLQLIAAAFDRLGEKGTTASAQVLVLVPEISLTPQMTRVFASRFPEQVAVVHSAMSDAERWQQMERVRNGAANILIGPRSAVFGPFRNLKLIVVDEEHDSSYKQATGLTYNGRDVAILRGKLEDACVVLGSATPSLESFENARKLKYDLQSLLERVGGRPLPTVSLVNHKPAYALGELLARGSGGGEGAEQISIADSIIEALRRNHLDGKQSIVIVNRRGYAYYLLSLNEKKAVVCPSCSISLTLHKRKTVLRCHYCDYQTTTQAIIAASPTDQFLAVGYGSEKVESFLAEKLPGARLFRLDSDTAAQKGVLTATLAKFRNGEIDILVGTQILAKGHDFPKVTLIVILDVDQQLDLPDFRAGERTFQLLVQASGRAGRADHPGQVLMQTLKSAAHPVIGAAATQDYAAFAATELVFREKYQYPPFSKLIAIEITSEAPHLLTQHANRIQGWLDQMAVIDPKLFKNVKILGPAIPPIEKIRNRFRRTIHFSSANADELRRTVSKFLSVFQKLPGDLRMRIDVDPQSLI